MPSGSEVVWQFSVSRSTYKIYKICQFVGLKKKEVTTIVCVFLRKAPTKKKTKLVHVFQSSTIGLPLGIISENRVEQFKAKENDP